MTVLGRFAGLDADLEWVATPAGLNRYNAAGENTATWYPEPGDVLTMPVPVPAVGPAGDVTPEMLAPPLEVYQTLGADQAHRWGYDQTLDQEELAGYIRHRAGDGNLRSDVDVVWRFAVYHFFGPIGRRAS
jgi:hypothetical protein